MSLLRYNGDMVYRLIDKFILCGLSVAALFLLFGEESGRYTIVQNNEFTVACVLGIVIALLVTEVFRNQYVSAGVLILAGAMSFLIPEASIAIPAGVYGLFSDSKMEELLTKWHSQKNASKNDWSIASEKTLWIKVILFAGACAVLFRSYLVLLIPAAALMAVKTVFMHRKELLLTEKFDAVRYDAQQSQRLKNEIANNVDMQIRNATLSERNRIAREIHDNVGHMLTRSLLQSGALLVINKDEELREPLESLKSTLDSAMTSIRESVHDLHDDSIDLKKVIEDSIKTVDSRFTVTLDCDVSEYMAGNVKLCMIGVIKEGLSNAVKHSAGDKISIIVREHPAFYQLMLEDNGSCSEIKESGIGLKNMRDRVEALKGRISFTPSAEGFKIFVSIPKQ